MTRKKETIKIAVLASGRGSNFIAIADAISRGEINADIAFLFSNSKEAKAIEAAEKRGIKTKVVDSRSLSKEEYDKKLIEVLTEEEIDLVLLAGYMKIVGKALIETFPLRIMNIHPSLLPSFKGLHAQRQAIEYGVKVSGCTVHFVDEGMDRGPIIIQSAIPVLDDDTAESLSNRILIEEHRLYAKAVKLFAHGKLRVEGRKVFIDSK
ncbi:MAG: phosphoribosylglycinamide formyltransferase [Proteobacteria bacterium]|nr:phosphoribosylglycinamide formyltransferase [Pseudomonadota bacterium]